MVRGRKDSFLSGLLLEYIEAQRMVNVGLDIY